MPSTRVPASLQIGGVTVAPATVLAPMAGVTDTVFRRFIRNASLFSPQSSMTRGISSAKRVRPCGKHWTNRSAISNPAAASS